MPTREELGTLVDKKHSPTIDPVAFPNTASGSASEIVSGFDLIFARLSGVLSKSYWSSSSVTDDGSRAWHVGFGNGSDGWNNKNGDGQVRLVRSEQ